MARRLADFDARRGAPVDVRIADTTVRGYHDESIAAAALATGTRVMSRSLKYHRPRTFFCLEGHCSGCLVRIDGMPNLRACQTPCAAGAQVDGQNAFPSTEVDLLGAVDFLFARGLDHHTLMTGSSVLNRLANKVVRQLSGLGKLPAAEAGALPAVRERTVDVCIIGGGAAGLAAALATARAGKSTIVIDDQLRPGGSLRADPRAGRAIADARVAEAVAAGVELYARTTAIGWFPEDSGGVLAAAAPDELLRVHARAWIWATGGYAVNLPFPDNDRPGVIAARAVGRLLADHGILAGDQICIVEHPGVADDTAALVTALRAAGAEVNCVRADQVTAVRGHSWAKGLDAAGDRYMCDVIAVAAIPAPASEGPRQHGCEVVLDPPVGGFRVVIDPDGATATPGVWACGDVCGYRGPAVAAAHGAQVGATVARAL